METTPGFEGLKHGTCNRTIHVAMPGNFRRDAARISAQWLNTTQLPGVDSPWSQGCKGEKKQGFKLRKLIIRDYQRYYSSTIVYEVSTSTPKTPDRKFVSPHLSGPMVFRLQGFASFGFPERFGGAAGGMGYRQNEAHQVFGSMWGVLDTAWTNRTVCPDLYQISYNIMKYHTISYRIIRNIMY